MMVLYNIFLYTSTVFKTVDVPVVQILERRGRLGGDFIPQPFIASDGFQDTAPAGSLKQVCDANSSALCV